MEDAAKFVLGLLSAEDSNIRIFKFNCPLHFANVSIVWSEGYASLNNQTV